MTNLLNSHYSNCLNYLCNKALVDGQERILANSTTEHTADDRSQMENLLKSIKTKELLGDPGYEGENIYQLLKAKGIKPTIRPPNHANQV